MLFPFGTTPQGLTPVETTYHGHAESDTNASTHTFSSQAVGPADGGRMVIVGIASSGAGNPKIASVTIGGISAQQGASGIDGAGYSTRSDLWFAIVPTGTTADVVVTSAATQRWMGITVWTARNMALYPVAQLSLDSSSPSQGHVHVPAGGAAFGVADYDASGVVWTGLTEHFEQEIQTGEGYDHAAASDEYADEVIHQEIKATYTGGSSYCMAALVFAPAELIYSAGAFDWNQRASTTVVPSVAHYTVAIPNDRWALGTVGLSSGKHYFEFLCGSGSNFGVGVSHAVPPSQTATFYATGQSGHTAYGYTHDGDKQSPAGGNVSYGSTYTSADVIGVALDLDNGKVWFAKNNVWQASGDPAAGTGEAFSGLSGTFFAAAARAGSGTSGFTLRSHVSTMSYSPPAGFTAGYGWQDEGILVARPACNGKPIGNMTANGGLRAAHDETWLTGAKSSRGTTSNNNHIGLLFESALTPGMLTIQTPSDGSSYNTGDMINVAIEGSNDTTTGVDGSWTSVYSGSFTDGVAKAVKFTGITQTAYTAFRIRCTNKPAWNLSGVRFYENL